jgi:hypothetical protein
MPCPAVLASGHPDQALLTHPDELTQALLKA